MIPDKISHFQIKEKLGAGGMGEVFLAHDTLLDRSVPLKILPKDFVNHLIFDGGHTAPRKDVVKVVLDWLDRYLGPV